MKLRWLICFLVVVGLMVAACAYRGNVTINTKDSFRFISPDVELYPEIKTETTIDNDDDGNPAKEEKK